MFKRAPLAERPAPRMLRIGDDARFRGDTFHDSIDIVERELTLIDQERFVGGSPLKSVIVPSTPQILPMRQRSAA